MRFLNFIGICLLTSACAPITATPPSEPGFPGASKPSAASQATNGANAPDPVAESLAYLQQDKVGLALTKIDQALLDNPNDVQTLNVAGLVYEQMGDIDTALIHLSNAVFAKPDDAYSRNNYGALLCRLGQPREAIEQFERAARLSDYQTPDIAFTNAGLCAQKIPDVELAEKYFNRALHINPKSAVALYQIAKISFQQNRFVAAREDLQHYLRVAPHTPKTLLLRVQIENALGNDTARDAYAKRLIDLFPDAPEARLAFALDSPDVLTRRLNASKDPQPAPIVDRENCPPVQVATAPEKSIPEKSAPAEVTRSPAPAKTPAAKTNATAQAPTKSNSTAGTIKGTAWVLAQDPQRYTVQLRAQRDNIDLLGYAESNSLTDVASYFEFPRNGDTWYALLYSDFDSAEDAELAAITLLPTLKDNKPWVRQFGEIQALIVQDESSPETRTQ